MLIEVFLWSVIFVAKYGVFVMIISFLDLVYVVVLVNILIEVVITKMI